MRFLEHSFVKRSGRELDVVCIPLPADDTQEHAVRHLLRGGDNRGHVLVEYLRPGAVTRLYLDHDSYFDAPPTEAQRAQLEDSVRERCDDLAYIMQGAGAVSYRIATRHGFSTSSGKHKLSFRPYFSGARVLYTDIPALLRVAGQAEEDFWDMSVYSKGEQVIAAIHGAKSWKDRRVLQPEAPDDDVLDYVVQHTDPNWPLFQPPERSTTGAIGANVTRTTSNAGESECDPVLVRRLLACLKPETARYRDPWLRLGMALRRLAVDFFDDWVEFSRRGGDGFKDEEDCRRTWESLQQNVGISGVTLGTLHYYAKRDDPDEYEAAVRDAKRTRAVAPKSPALTVEMAGDLARRLRDRFPDRFGGLPDDMTFEVSEGFVATFHWEGMETRVDKDYSVYVAGLFAGSLCPDAPIKGPLTLHKTVEPDLSFIYNRLTEDKARLVGVGRAESRTVAATEIDVFHVRTETAKYAQIRREGERNVTVDGAKKLKELSELITSALRQHGANTLGPLNQLFVGNNIGTINVYTGGEGETPFDVIRVKLLEHASSRRYMKAEGVVYAPVPGCPCAYTQLCTYEEYINQALKGDSVYLSNPKRFKEAMEFMKNYRVDEMPEHNPDPGLLSFRNGVLLLDDVVFTENAAIRDNHPLCRKVARHHIDLEYTGCTDTPLLDSVLDAQFDKDVAQLLCALLGRLLFPVGKYDNWQVMPYIVGVGGTGKSIHLGIVQRMFPVGAVGSLIGKREDVFGMANLADKDVVIGRDMPKALSGVLSQELMQCMTAGEHMEVPRKGTTALNVQWTAPVVMASNHFPDYVNTGGNVSRRLVPFYQENPISAPNETLLEDILATELPNVVARFLSAYRDARAAAKEAGGFWKSVPPKIKEWQGTLSAATNKLHHFLSMDEEERGCKIERVEGKITCLIDFKAKYKNKMETDCVIDRAILAGLGYRVSTSLEYVCKTCRQLAKARGERCCEHYSQSNRWKREVIYDMEMGPTLCAAGAV